MKFTTLSILAFTIWAQWNDPLSEYCLPVNMDECTREVDQFGLVKPHLMLFPPRFNYGVNFTLPTGSQVYSISDGVVKKAESNGGFGKHLIIKLNDSTSVIYAHLSSELASINDIVKCGQIIGLVGSTGACTAPHLHMRITVNGEAVDPRKFLAIPSTSSRN